MKRKISPRKIRHRRLRERIKGTAKRPRLSVFRSNMHIYGQIIDDEKAKTLVSFSDLELKTKSGKKDLTKINRAKEVGINLAEKAIAKNIKQVVFDRGGYKYHGRVKALTEGTREGGLIF